MDLLSQCPILECLLSENFQVIAFQSRTCASPGQIFVEVCVGKWSRWCLGAAGVQVGAEQGQPRAPARAQGWQRVALAAPGARSPAGLAGAGSTAGTEPGARELPGTAALLHSPLLALVLHTDRSLELLVGCEGRLQSGGIVGWVGRGLEAHPFLRSTLPRLWQAAGPGGSALLLGHPCVHGPGLLPVPLELATPHLHRSSCKGNEQLLLWGRSLRVPAVSASKKLHLARATRFPALCRAGCR